MECKKCSGTNHYKNGFVKEYKRYKSKECWCQFVPALNKGCDKQTKADVCLLYLNGLCFRTIARLLNVSSASLFYWVKSFAVKQYEKPKPAEEAIIIELDKMWHFYIQKKQALDLKGIWCNAGQLID